jgi:hypothetical protein
MDYQSASQFWIKKDQDAVKMKEEDLKKAIEDFVGAHKVCALACAAGDFVRCTPIEYHYLDGCFYMFSEGGLKFKALQDNKHVCLAIFEQNASFGDLHSLQVSGKATMIEPFGEEYVKVASARHIPIAALKKLESPMYLIKVVPSVYDFLNSDFKKDGYSSRQQLTL